MSAPPDRFRFGPFELHVAARELRKDGVRVRIQDKPLELLRLALVERSSRWSGALEAVCATLPPLRGDEHEAIRRLAAEGPPEEEVGLAPYGTSGPTLLPVPPVPSRGAS